jgi:hypothetical protein
VRLQREVTKWKEFERTRNPSLKGKGTFGADYYKMWFVVETQADFDRLSLEYPGQIILCDRSYLIDTYKEKCIDGTTRLHEVCSVDTTIPVKHPRHWTVRASNFMCTCDKCRGDPYNTECVYLPWRQRRDVTMRINCVGPKEAVSWVSETISWDNGDKKVCGTITEFDMTSKRWTVKFDDKGMARMQYTLPTKKNGEVKKNAKTEVLSGWTVGDEDTNSYNYEEICTCTSSSIGGLGTS